MGSPSPPGLPPPWRVFKKHLESFDPDRTDGSLFEEKLKTLHKCQNKGFLEHEMALVFHVYFRTMPWTDEQITEFHEKLLSHRLSFLYKRASESGAVPLDG